MQIRRESKGSITWLQIIQSMKDVALEDQAEMLAKQLSGGQKRKLSVAIALIGDPKVIIVMKNDIFAPKSHRGLKSNVCLLRISLF